MYFNVFYRECLLLGHPLIFFVGAAALLKTFEEKDNKPFLLGFFVVFFLGFFCLYLPARLQPSSESPAFHENNKKDDVVLLKLNNLLHNH